MKVVHRHSSHGQPSCGVYPAGAVAERERLIAGYEEELRRVMDRESELRDLIARLSTPLSSKRSGASKALGRIAYSEAQMLRMRVHATYMRMLRYFEPHERDVFRAIYSGSDVHAAIRAMEERLKGREQSPCA